MIAQEYSALREFFETTGLAVGLLIVLIILLIKGTRAAWEFVKPKISELFDKHFRLVDSLINRNEQESLTDEIHQQQLRAVLTTRQAAKLCEHHCAIAEDLARAKGIDLSDSVRPLREEIARMKENA